VSQVHTPDILALDHGPTWSLSPRTAKGRAWLSQNVRHDGAGALVQRGRAIGLVEAMEREGTTVRRGALRKPNTISVSVFPFAVHPRDRWEDAHGHEREILHSGDARAPRSISEAAATPVPAAACSQAFAGPLLVPGRPGLPGGLALGRVRGAPEREPEEQGQPQPPHPVPPHVILPGER